MAWFKQIIKRLNQESVKGKSLCLKHDTRKNRETGEVMGARLPRRDKTRKKDFSYYFDYDKRQYKNLYSTYGLLDRLDELDTLAKEIPTAEIHSLIEQRVHLEQELEQVREMRARVRTGQLGGLWSELTDVEKVLSEILEKTSNAIPDRDSAQQKGLPEKLKEKLKHVADAQTSQLKPHLSDLDFLIEHLYLFDVYRGNPFQLYWLRSHPNQSDSQPFYSESAYASVGAPESDESASIIINGPDFSSRERTDLAFEHLVNNLVSFIKKESATKRVVHQNDKVVYDCCRRLAAGLGGRTLKEALYAPSLAAKERIENIIVESYDRELKHLYAKLDKKKPFIKSKFAQATIERFDEYGEPVLADIEFATRNILSGINVAKGYDDEFRLFSDPYEDFVTHAIAYMDQWIDSIQSTPAPDDGFEFERWVADELNRYGWTAYATVGSGDQGVDVIAVSGDVSIGIQCKRYSGAVGNKAVQEIYTGVKHRGLDFSVVLSNASFTKSAKELAETTQTLLVNVGDIPELHSLVLGSSHSRQTD